MLTKVTNRVRRRSLAEDGPITYRIRAVTVAPDLLRWSDFANPFPPVALGGYTRYYASKAHTPEAGQELTYCPELSRHPDFTSSTLPSSASPSSIPSPTSDSPSLKSPLFPLSSKPEEPSTPPKRPLTIIHEASRESMSPGSPRRAGQSSLRRRRRQLLRTPSIERDFAVTARNLFSSSTSSLYPPSSSFASPTESNTTPPFPLHIRSVSMSSSESHGSEDSHRTSSDESAQSEEYPITPTISVDSGEVRKGYGDTLVLGDTGEFNFIVEDMDANPTILSLPTLKVESVTPRPESWASFSTARSDFGTD